MEELRQEFLREATAALENLQSKLQTETFTENLQREIFRRLHTLKGTSQTFDLNVSGKLAHEIENVLQAAKDKKIKREGDFIALLKEGFEILLETFRRAQIGRENAFPAEFVEKIKNLIPDYSATALSENALTFIPRNYLAQLSAHEKNSLIEATAGGKNFFLIEAGFDFVDFEEKFKSLRQILSERGEILATFPSPKFGAENKIGFQFFFVAKTAAAEIEKLLVPFEAGLILQNATNNFAADLKGVLAQAVLTGEKTAQALGKKVEFEVTADGAEVSNKRLKLVSDVLLHLVRNAVDHAFETGGKIKIELSKQENSLILRVADDGRGIDVEEIKAQALRKNLVSPDEFLSRREALQLIFIHGFSTSKTVSEISGRGVGLDVVQDEIKKAGGEIRVESEMGNGTTFEIYLPNDEKSAEK